MTKKADRIIQMVIHPSGQIWGLGESSKMYLYRVSERRLNDEGEIVLYAPGYWIAEENLEPEYEIE